MADQSPKKVEQKPEFTSEHTVDEEMKMDFHRDLELQKRHIMERAHAEIAKIQHGDDEENDLCRKCERHKEYLMNHLVPTPRIYVSAEVYKFTKKTEVLFTKIIPLTQKVEVIGAEEE